MHEDLGGRGTRGGSLNCPVHSFMSQFFFGDKTESGAHKSGALSHLVVC